MVEQSRELLLFSFLRCLTHADQPLGHTNPALCRVCGGWAGVLLSPRASLPYLRGPWFTVVRQVHRCRVGGGAVARWPPSAAQTARTVFPYAAFTKVRNDEVQSKVLTQPD